MAGELFCYMEKGLALVTPMTYDIAWNFIRSSFNNFMGSITPRPHVHAKAVGLC